jgi:hypothetical protein
VKQYEILAWKPYTKRHPIMPNIPIVIEFYVMIKAKEAINGLYEVMSLKPSNDTDNRNYDDYG